MKFFVALSAGLTVALVGLGLATAHVLPVIEPPF